MVVFHGYMKLHEGSWNLVMCSIPFPPNKELHATRLVFDEEKWREEKRRDEKRREEKRKEEEKNKKKDKKKKKEERKRRRGNEDRAVKLKQFV